MKKEISPLSSRPAKAKRKESPDRRDPIWKKGAGAIPAKVGNAPKAVIQESRQRNQASAKNWKTLCATASGCSPRYSRDNAAAIVLTRVRATASSSMSTRNGRSSSASRADEVIGKTAADNLWSGDIPRNAGRQFRNWRSRAPLHNRECEFVRKDGEVWIALMSAEVIRLQGEPVNLSFPAGHHEAEADRGGESQPGQVSLRESESGPAAESEGRDPLRQRGEQAVTWSVGMC